MKTAALCSLVFLVSALAYLNLAAVGWVQPAWPQVCPVPKGLYDPAWLKGGDGGATAEIPCFEFWFARYQTFFGALIALAAATMTFLPARAQLRETARQTAAALRQTFVAAAQERESERSQLQSAIPLAFDIQQAIFEYQRYDWEDIYHQWSSAFDKLRIRLGQTLAEIRRMQLRGGGSPATVAARERLLLRTRALETAMLIMSRVFRDQTTGFDQEFEDALTPDEESFRPSKAEAALDSWQAALLDLERLIESDIIDDWRFIREMEERASKR